MNKSWSGAIGAALAMLLAASVCAEECTITEDRSAGVIVVRTAAGREIRGLSDEAKRNVLRQGAELDAAKAELALAKSEIEALKKQISAYEQIDQSSTRVLAKQKDYIGDLEQAVNGYRSLAEDYRKLTRPTTLTLEAGIGATGGDTKPALMLGVGIRRLRVWGFFQENNTGALVGIQYPLF